MTKHNHVTRDIKDKGKCPGCDEYYASFVEEEPEAPTKKLVLGTVMDLVSNFLYYSRKEDEDLPVGAIEEMIEKGAITVDEIVDCFRSELVKGS